MDILYTIYKTAFLPGIEPFEVNSSRGNDLLPQFQMFPQSLDH